MNAPKFCGGGGLTLPPSPPPSIPERFYDENGALVEDDAFLDWCVERSAAAIVRAANDSLPPSPPQNETTK